MLSRSVLVAAVAALATLVESSTDVVAPRQPREMAPAITLEHIHRRLAELSVEKRGETFTNSTSLDASFSGITLYKYEREVEHNVTSGDKPAEKDAKESGKAEISQELTTSGSIEIICSRCYTRGDATATLRLDGEFNATAAYQEVEDSVEDTIDQLKHWVKNIDADASEFKLDIPAPNITFDVDMPAFPGAVLEFQFDGVEMFVELDIVLKGGMNYRLSLYKSHELGVELAEDLFFGFVFGIDLILTAEAEMTITSGFHVLLDDGVLLKLALFAKETSDIQFNGGKFEFLPVTIKAGSALLRGVIQLSLRAGFSMSSPDLTPGFNFKFHNFDFDESTRAEAGIEARVYANVAELVTNVTANFDEEAECALNVVQEYTFAVGVAAGATVGFAGHVWGPAGATETALFSTTLADVCAIAKTAATAAPELEARATQDDEELTTTTITREQTYSVMQCASTGLVECPASLITLHENIRTETLVTAVSSGVEATWPEATRVEAQSRIAFGDNVKNMESETPAPTGAPTGAPEDDDDQGFKQDVDEVVNGETGGVSNKLIIGLSVGLGVPFIIALVAGLILWRRRSQAVKYAPAGTTVEMVPTSSSYTGVDEAKNARHDVQPVYRD
jgi:hypothetical protein